MPRIVARSRFHRRGDEWVSSSFMGGFPEAVLHPKIPKFA